MARCRKQTLLLVLSPLLLWAGAEAASAGDGGMCAVNLVEDLPPEEPVLLKRSCEGGARGTCAWKLPQGDKALSFRPGEEALLACTGKGNHFQRFANQSPVLAASVLGCSAPNTTLALQVNNTKYSVKELACSRVSKGQILNKNEMCGPRNAVLLELGYNIQNQWYPLIEVCHVVSRSDTLFTQHVLQGESNKKRRTAQRPSFEVGGDFYQGFSPNTAYQNANKTLLEIVERDTLPRDVSTAINRGHLSPDGDFLPASFRASTYFYVNTAPMWRAINIGNWLLLENMLRKYAKSNSVDLHIATGVFRIMELKDKRGDLREFFLYSAYDRKQIPVPKYIWKVVYDKEKKAGIAFVVINDPFRKSVFPSEILCPDVCEQFGWGRNDRRWKVIDKGYLFCCEIKELKKYISYISKYDVKSILSEPRT